MCFDSEQYSVNARNIQKEIFSVLKLQEKKNNTTKILHFFISFKKNKKRLLLLIPENTIDRAFSARKSKMPTEYREKGIKRFKNQIFQMYLIF